jgi:hypothetical protein
MSNLNHYYLYKAGKMVGPITELRLDAMRRSGEILHYSWIIDQLQQEWSPVDHVPHENPFLATKEAIGERVISGAFLWLTRPYIGLVKGIHSFGLELFVDKASLGTSSWKNVGLSMNSAVQLNLVDETHAQWLNAKVVFQTMEEQGDGLLLRFGWSDAPVRI